MQLCSRRLHSGNQAPGVKSLSDFSLALRSKALALTIASVLASPNLLGADAVTIPAATPFPVQLVQHVQMKDGEPLAGRLLYPIYAENRIAVPAGSMLYGRVVQLRPDRSRRLHSRLWGDFTPFHIPTIHFDRLVLPDGKSFAIVSDNATDGAPLLRLTAPSAKSKTGLVSRQIADAKRQAKEEVTIFTAPGKADRLLQFVYRQLPYHPERINADTAWTVELTQPLTLPPERGDAGKADPPPTPRRPDLQTVPSENVRPAWNIHAYLQQTISSNKSKAGDTVEAVVAEPVLRPEGSIAIPQGTTLSGTVTQARAARWFSRRGKLRFTFRQLKLPDGFAQHVEGNLSAADSDGSQSLELDPEGGVQPKAQNRVAVPLLLSLLAGRAFDDDGNQIANGAVASNGFGLVGRITGIVASSRNVAAGIGFYAAALSFYSRWLARGKDVEFVKNTRIEVTTTPTRIPMGAP
jgi:hypothetical protein